MTDLSTSACADDTTLPATEPVDETEAVRRSVDAQFPIVAAFLAAERGEQA